MEQRGSTSDALVKDAQAILRMEECALSMEQSANYVRVGDAQIKSCDEESVGVMEQAALHTTNLLLLDRNTKTLPLLIYHIPAQLMR